MMLKTAIGHSMEFDSQDAVEEVLEQCRNALGEVQPQAGILFASGNHNLELILNRIAEMYTGIELIGCFSLAEISSVHGYAEDSIVLTLFYSEELYFKAGAAEKISEDPFRHLSEAIEAAKASLGQEPTLCIILPSIEEHGIDVIEGLQNILGETFPIFGGLEDHFVYGNNHINFHSASSRPSDASDAVPFLLVAGPVLFSYGAEGIEWLPIGKKVKVTQSDGKVVYKIGDQSATDFYTHYLGETRWRLDNPLAIFEDDEKSFYLRSSREWDEETGSVTFSGNVPEGSTVQITYITRDGIIKAAKKSVNSAAIEYRGSKPSVALCFSSYMRMATLGTRVEEEYRALKSMFPDLPTAGFYGGPVIGPSNRNILSMRGFYGGPVIRPSNRGKPSMRHGGTFYTLLIGSE